MTKDRAVLFVNGAPRSGTTLFGLVLGTHSQGFALGEFDQFGHADRTVAREGRYCGICEGRCPFWEGRIAPDFAARRFGSRLRRGWTRLVGREGLYEEVFAALPGTRFLVDASKPAGWIRARLADRRDWRSADPMLLFVTRDGRAVLNSWMRKFPDTPVDEHIDRWLRVVEALERTYDRFPGAKRRMSYEAFAADPEGSARELAAWIGVAPEEGMTRYWTADHHAIGGNVGTRSLIFRHRAEGEGAALPFAPSSAAKTAYYAEQGLRIFADERWREELPTEALARFEKRAAEANAPAYRPAA